MRALYEAAKPMPTLKVFNAHNDGKDCCLDYSNPEYFYQHWEQKEIEKMTAMTQKKKEKKKKRKKKKKQITVAKVHTIMTVSKIYALSNSNRQHTSPAGESGDVR